MIVRNRDSPSLAHSFRYRSAVPSDGASLWHLVQAAGTLELNSAYFYLLFATDFGRTCQSSFSSCSIRRLNFPESLSLPAELLAAALVEDGTMPPSIAGGPNPCGNPKSRSMSCCASTRLRRGCFSFRTGSSPLGWEIPRPFGACGESN